MESYYENYTNQLMKEIKATPGEYLPSLLGLVRIFRESVTLKSAENSFRKGWEEAMRGETTPVDELWADIGNEG